VGGEAGEERLLRVEAGKAHKVKPERGDENRGRAEPAFYAEGPVEVSTLPGHLAFPFPEEGVECGEEQRCAKDAEPEGRPTSFCDDDEAAEDDFFNDCGDERIGRKQCRHFRLFAGDAEGEFAPGFSGYDDQSAHSSDENSAGRCWGRAGQGAWVGLAGTMGTQVVEPEFGHVQPDSQHHDQHPRFVLHGRWSY